MFRGSVVVDQVVARRGELPLELVDELHAGAAVAIDRLIVVGGGKDGEPVVCIVERATRKRFDQPALPSVQVLELGIEEPSLIGYTGLRFTRW